MKKVNRGWFQKGIDRRRHELTIPEKSRGGQTRFLQIMVQFRCELGLPLIGAYDPLVKLLAKDWLFRRMDPKYFGRTPSKRLKRQETAKQTRSKVG